MVEPGDLFYKVVVKLGERRIISSPWLFSKVGVLAGLDRHIIPGRYDFGRRLSNYAVMKKLWRGDIAILGLTIPEGYTLRQIGNLLSTQCGTDIRVFDSLVRDSLFLSSLGVSTGFAEGYLFPETYRFQWGITAAEAIGAMVRQTFVCIDSARLARAGELGYSLHDLLTMASIVESEASALDEYPLIASVYRNRYVSRMKLQADPTVIYGMGGLDRSLLIKDYQFPSRYNTYLYRGLPPTPICSPGLAAMEATLDPAETDYLYFVADGSGRHIFNKTYREHLQDTRRVKGKTSL